MRALDLFCCAGGATKGLQRAGFHVTGVDIRPQPRYCGDAFFQADALAFPLDGFDFIWASPPCQGYTAMRHAPGTKGAPQLIDTVRGRMPAGVPWVIENVEEAAWALRNPVTLCGSMFGLGAQGCRTQRHRLFESNFPIPQPPCRHDSRPVIGVYGGHARKRAASAGGRGTKDVWAGGHKTAAAKALGIDWATLAEMSEAIPPAYAEFIGRAAVQHTRLIAAAPDMLAALWAALSAANEMEVSSAHFPREAIEAAIAKASPPPHPPIGTKRKPDDGETKMTTTIAEPKYPDVHVQLSGEDGNAFSIIGRVSQAMRRAGVSKAEIDAFGNEAMSGDYDNVLRTVMRWVSTA